MILYSFVKYYYLRKFYGATQISVSLKCFMLLFRFYLVHKHIWYYTCWMFNCSCNSALSWWFKTFNLLICMDFICFDSIDFSNGQMTDHDVHGKYIPAWWVRGHVYTWNLVLLSCIYFLLARCGGLSPQNVQVTYSRGRVNAQFPTGTVAFFACNQGYTEVLNKTQLT